jgi:hypothetical protein
LRKKRRKIDKEEYLLDQILTNHQQNTSVTAGTFIKLSHPSSSYQILFVWGQEKWDVIPTLPNNAISANSNDDVKQSTHHRQKEHEDDRIHKTIIFTVFYKYPSFNETNAILIDDSPVKFPYALLKNCSPSTFYLSY